MTRKPALITLKKEDKYQILRDYIESTSITEIAEKYKVPRKTIESFISKFYKEFTASKELHSLIETTNLGTRNRLQSNYRKPSYICDEMLKKIEDEEADLVYAYSYYLTKDNVQALKESGLYNIGKVVNAAKTNENIHKLKGQYLRSLSTVKTELKRLTKESLVDSNVSPEFIQSSLLEQLEQLNSYEYLGNKERQLLLRTLELLGKTVSAYSDKLTVETINPSDALDQLIEMTNTTPSTYSVVNE